MTPLDRAVSDIRELDRSYLEPRIRELAVALESDDISERWRRWTS